MSGNVAAWRPVLKDGVQPIYLRIADAIADDILSGRLAVGERLPPLRDLASGLKLNYATVSRAYSEAQRRGLIYSRVGQGSFVCRPGGVSRRSASAGRSVDMTMNLPPESQSTLLRERMEAGLRALGPDLQPLMRYQEFGGSAEDKEAAVAWLQRRPLNVDVDRVLVCPGVQSALLAVLGSLARPGDVVLCEALTYPGLRAIAGQLGIRLLGLPLDEDGIDPDALARLCAEHHPKALYCNPVLLNPAVVTLSEERRHRLVQIARKHNLAIIEDDAYGLLPNMTWIIGRGGLILYKAAWTDPADVDHALAASLEALPRRAHDQLMPAYSELLIWRAEENDLFIEISKLVGPQAIRDQLGRSHV